jgi:hypothetical protein
METPETPGHRKAGDTGRRIAMSLHSLLSVTVGVPNVGETAAYYADFGLTPADDGWFSTADAGRQLRLLPSPVRRLLELRVGADDADDLARAAAGLAALGVPSGQDGTSISTTEPVTGTRVVIDVAPRTRQGAIPATPYNGPGRLDRPDTRAPGFTRPDRVRPRKLGHAVFGSTDYAASTAFFAEGLGFKISDRIKGVGAFMRCSTDHHNVLVLAAPVSFLHHTSWQVDDVDDVGRGAQAMLEGRPERHVWVSAGTTRARTSSGTSRTRRATSPSTTATWTASSTTSSGPRRIWRGRGGCSPGARRRPPPSCIPKTLRP